MGDKGAYLYAAFGAPRAQGDDAARAVATALELVALEGPEIGDVSGLAAGVAYGAMYTGAYGATSRTTYGVLGPKTNLAARLMVRAGVGEVLCDPPAAPGARCASRPCPPRRSRASPSRSRCNGPNASWPSTSGAAPRCSGATRNASTPAACSRGRTTARAATCAGTASRGWARPASSAGSPRAPRRAG